MPPMTGRQRAFILEYPKDFNATQAAIRAGYSAKTAYSIGQENLRKPEIKVAIDKEFRQRTLALDEVLARLTEHATASIADFIVVNPDGDRISINPEVVTERGHLIKRIRAKTTVRFDKDGNQMEYTTIEIVLHDSQKALELLGKHLGMFKEEMVLSWKREAEEAGLPASEVFDRMVGKIIAEMRQSLISG